MDELQRFYKSREWEAFRKIVISERTDSNGFVRCAYCGEPILKPYDLIVHHKKELTLSNVHDALIALNPDNCECVHFKCHNAIHERFQGGNGGYKPKPKRVYLVYGAPCSGKTTWVHSVKTEKDLIVDMDNVWECVTGLERYSKPDALRSVAFDVRDKLYDVAKYRAGKWANCYVISGSALRGDRERLAVRIGADELIYIEATKDECLERLECRGLDDSTKQEWEGYIVDWFTRYQP